MKPNLLDLDPVELEDVLLNKGQKKYRIKQLLNWIYKQHTLDYSLMTNLPGDLKQFLQEEFSNYLPSVIEERRSEDGTVKYLLELVDENRIEMVLIPREERTTLCVSSQVGCARDCLFCATARIGLIRNLHVNEILAQIMIALQKLSDRKLTNIVFMGMGEPLDNYDNVMKALKILQHDECFSFSPRRITLSTSGIIPRIRDLADSGLKVKLAVSLNAAIQSKREKLMPVSRQYPLTELKKTLQYFRRKTSFRITFEYVMIKDFNIGGADRKALINFLGDISCKLNLIIWNKVDHLPFEVPEEKDVTEFVNELNKLSSAVTFRSSRGADINAACGQLAGNYY